MSHLDDVMLQEYIDGQSDRSVWPHIENHLRECGECRLKLRALQQLDAAIRRVPLETVSATLTGKVLDIIGVFHAPGLAKILFRNFLPLFLILVIAATVVLFAGGAKTGALLSGGSKAEYVTRYQEGFDAATSSGFSVIRSWSTSVINLLARLPVLRLVVMLGILFAAFTIFDQFVFVPFMRRRL